LEEIEILGGHPKLSALVGMLDEQLVGIEDNPPNPPSSSPQTQTRQGDLAVIDST